MMSDCVNLQGVRKSFKNKEVLKGLDLRVPKGSVFGLIGPNGAGKTTTLKIILNLYRAAAGSVEVFGKDIRHNEIEVKRDIGFVSETRALPDYMTPEELLKAVKPLYPRWNPDRVQKYIDRFKVPVKTKIGNLSLGERTRVALLCAVAHDPALLVLDEPTNGLDALAREVFFRTLSEEYSDSEGSVLIASNVIPEVERVCDHLAIIADGRVLLAGSVEDLKESVKMVQFRSDGDRDWSGHPAVIAHERTGEVTTLVTRAPPDGLIPEIELLSPEFVRILNMNLTEIFVKVVSRWA